SHGIRGVEQITMGAYYKKGHIKYLSDEYFELVKHTVNEAKRLQMEVSFNFGGPGWIMGGEWVIDEDKSRDMIPTFIDISGSQKINIKLPGKLIKTNRSWEVYKPELSGNEELLAVVAGKINEGKIDSSSLTILTKKVSGNRIKWKVPKGKWRIMAFWLSVDKSHITVNHFDKEAMERFCNYLGGKYKEAVGNEFGKTVESFFGDSFELPYLASGIKWSDGLLLKFQAQYGYDLTKYLPAIWWNIENVSPKIRYDVNQFLSETAYNTFFETFIGWCNDNDVKGRIQPYGFETDILKGAGMVDIPEMEITPGEKDQHPWFDTRIGPKKYVASGAHIYGKNIISAEVYTFLHHERYRATLEELKIASDGFLRSGANKFYNHGYSASQERDLAPTRRTGWAAQINPVNVWWQYYPLLSEYIARSSYILRQGHFVADIAIYSPLANQWSKNVLNARRWTRDFDWGELGNLLISNGYDFDLLNDDALQNIAEFENSTIKIRNIKYKILLLPNIESIPIKTLKRIEEYIIGGGTVIALDRLPGFSTGYTNHIKNDKEVQNMVSKLFNDLNGRSLNPNRYGQGNIHYLKKVIHREIWWNQYSSSLDPFLKTIKKYVKPDFEIDFVGQEMRHNNGLSYLHRKTKDADIYFVTNIQDREVAMPVNFRISNKRVWTWNPYNGDIKELFHYSSSKNGINIPINLQAWESTILVFEDSGHKSHVSETNFDKVVFVSDESITLEAKQNGSFYMDIVKGATKSFITKEIHNIPSPFIINGNWKLTLESANFTKQEKEMNILKSWTDFEETKHFSGTGKYNIDFNLPAAYVKPDLRLELALGKLGNIAEVEINGKKAGIVWMKGQKCDITQLIKKGKNNLSIKVTNTNINRVSSFKNAVPVPENLVDDFGSAKISGSLPREFGFEPLPPSGLMGPVKIIPNKIVKIQFLN
ncbi:MAG: hypothetical protein DRJ10_14475, partial [Bacteroidetes bacterium]